MRRIFPTVRIACALLFVLLLAAAAKSQTVSAAKCKAAIDALQAELNTANLTSARQDEQIKTLRADRDAADAEIKQLRAERDVLNKQVTELSVTQARLQEDTRATLEKSLESQRQVAESRDQVIVLQAKVIESLAKSIKRSSLEKLVDTLPSIAGIIAIALTHK